jgi:magnesium-transporting ATPase (P-type)
MLKEAYEDMQRRRSDNEMNARKTNVLDRATGQVKTVEWSAVRVGDIVKVEKD